MPITEDVQSAIADAMRKQDAPRLSALRMLKAAIVNREVEKGRALKDDEAQQVVSSLVKQRKDSIEQFTKGGRMDLVEKEAAEIKILETYLPPAIDPAELDRLVSEAIAEAGVTITREPKTELQEWLVKLGGKRPAYAISGRERPEHEPVFTVALEVDGFAPLTGKGRSKQAAEQAAALAFLIREGVRTAEGEG